MQGKLGVGIRAYKISMLLLLHFSEEEFVLEN